MNIPVQNFNLAAQIAEAVCLHFGLPLSGLTSRSHSPKYVWPKHVAIYLIEARTRYTREEIGLLFGLDHSTITYALQAVRNRLTTEAYAQADLGAIVQRLSPAAPPLGTSPVMSIEPQSPPQS